MPCVVHPDVVSGLSTCTRCAREFCPDCVISLNGNVICAACKGEAVMDIKSGYTEGALDFASPGRRFRAIFIDGFIVFVTFMIVTMVVVIPATVARQRGHAVPAPTGIGLMPFLFYAAPIIYEGILLSINGQTFGKMLLKIRVVRPNGDKIGAGQAWGRGLMRLLLRLLIIADPLFIFSKERRTLHDRICETRVINVK